MDLSLRTEAFGVDDQSWLGSAHGTDATESITLDTSAFTAGTHYTALGGHFKSGIALGKITATGLYGPYDGGAVDGREALAGFLYAAVPAPAAATTDPSGAMLVHGKVVTARLPVAVDAAGVADVDGRIRFI